ncbi:unnamed protein product [Rotaria sordida]|uniref:ethanolamine kinase n=1 Tax=Rotaria sordida TaxID=392033 RepID=A0A814LPG3_9BILA|nr:unnamed protein product [Rotaria sordida]CAF1066958.1 unnamed protein product [Rotaria sordida]
MYSYPIVKNVTLSLSNISNEIYEVINEIRPDWNSSNTRLVPFTEGITNAILAIFDNRTFDDQSNGLIIKLFGAHTELFIDRQSEINAMVKLSQYGVLSQHVLIQFNNGIIYEFTRGEACSREDVTKENISKLIAIKLAQFHSIPVEKYEKPYIISLIRRFIELISENEEQKKEISSIISDIDTIEEVILPKLVPNGELGKDLVYCHNDLLVKNIIYDKKSETISFIDFEYTRLNYYLFDIANHFVEYAGVDDADFNLYPTHDEQKRWLKIYFDERQMNKQIINDDLCYIIDKFSALAHLMWGLWALVQSGLSQIDFDYLNYAKEMSSSNVNICDDNKLLSEKVGYYLEEIVLKMMNEKQLITIGLSGGSLIDLLVSIVPYLQFPWSRIRFFFLDERFVPFTSDESTYGNYQSKLFRQLPITEKNIIKIDPTLKSVEECALDYQNKLQQLFIQPDNSFDIVLLGMGPDGHTASLFPNHPVLNINNGLVTYVKDSPKPPPERVTLTLNTINEAKYKIAVITGETKSTVVKQIIEDKNRTYPIGQLENLIWYLDKAAASKLEII